MLIRRIPAFVFIPGKAAGGDRFSMKKGLLLIGLIAALVGASGCSPPKEEKPVISKPRSVNTMRIGRRDLPIAVNAVGRLAPDREVVLSSQVSGIVQTYRVDTGDRVAAEETLVTLDPRDYQLALGEARANLFAARARYAAAKNSFLRAGQLLPENVITPEYFDQIEASYKAAQAAVSQAEASVDINQRRLDKSTIKAPFEGLVTRRLVEMGQNINVGDPVMAIADMLSMRVKIHVNEQDYVHLDKDDTVAVRVEAYPETAFGGKVDRIGVKADSQTNTFEVEILVANPELVLKAGLTAMVSIIVDEIRNAIMIPQNCVLFREGRQEVFVVTDQGTAMVRQVKLGRVDGSSVRILEGIAPGDRLVTTGSQYLKDGDSVVVVGSR
jgi:RND family efflux transporter MFP subunit